MATSITALTMRIGADTSALDKAAANMKRTMGTVSQVLRQAETPQQKLERQTAALSTAFEKGKISADQYAAGLKGLEKLKDVATGMEKTMSIVRGVLESAAGPQDKLAEKTRALNDAMHAGRITVEQYRKGLASLRPVSESHAKQAAIVKQIVEATVTPQQRLAEKTAALKAAFAAGEISAKQYADGLAYLKSQTDAARRSNQLLADAMAIVGQSRSPQQRLAEQVGTLRKAFAAGLISANQYSQGMAHLSTTTDAARKSQESLRIAMSVIASTRTPQELIAEKTKALSQAMREGKISADDYMRGMKSLEHQVPKTAGKFALLLRQILPIVTVFSAFRMVRRSMIAIDEAAKTATAIGDTVTNYMALAHALGEVAGMAEGQAENALKVMNMNLSQAAMFGGRGADAIKTLGLSLSSLMADRPAERFTKLVEAIAAHGNESEKASLAQALFGRSAKDVMAAINAQTGALRESQKAAHELGLTIGTDQARAIESANDAIGRLKTQGSVMFGELSAATAPVIVGFEKLTQKILTASSTAAQFGKMLLVHGTPILSIIHHFKMLGATIRPLVADTKSVADSVEQVAESAGRFVRPVRKVSDEYLAQKQELERQVQILNLGVDAYARMMDFRKGFNQAEVQTLQNLRDEIRMVEQRKNREQEIARLRKQAAEAFTKEAESALSAARQSLELEKQKAAEMRRHMQSSPPSLGVGSAEAAAFLAEQANAARGLQAAKDVTPGEKEIIAEAQKQLQLQRQQLAEDKRMVAEIIRLQRVTEASATRRVR